MGFGADVDAAASGFVGFADALGAVYQRAGGEIRPRQVAHQGAGFGVGVVKQVQAGVQRFAEVVRRYVGRHADGNAGAAIDKQVRYARGQYGRLLLAAVVVRREINGFFFNVCQQAVRDFRHARFGVAVGGRRVAVKRAEVALAVHQRIAQRERLRHAHQGVVNGAVAVRVVFPHHVTDDGRGFDVFFVPGVALFMHGKEDAAVHRFQAVARIRQGAADNHAHRIIKIRTAHLVFQTNRQHFFGKITHCFQPYNVKNRLTRQTGAMVSRMGNPRCAILPRALFVSFLQQNRARMCHFSAFSFAFLQQNTYDCARMGISCLFVGTGAVNLGRTTVHQS